jgi:hypothetical protein
MSLVLDHAGAALWRKRNIERNIFMWLHPAGSFPLRKRVCHHCIACVAILGVLLTQQSFSGLRIGKIQRECAQFYMGSGAGLTAR